MALPQDGAEQEELPGPRPHRCNARVEDLIQVRSHHNAAHNEEHGSVCKPETTSRMLCVASATGGADMLTDEVR